MQKAQWKKLAYLDQLSEERDFEGAVPIKFKYAICCNHRTGSNFLGEALYQTSVAGDPMEYLNQRFLKIYSGQPNLQLFDFDRYLDDMRSRRTSTNGVFGINVKFDQLRVCYGRNWQKAIGLIKDNDLVLYLYRKDKLRQAISLYIGQCKDTYNIPSGISDEKVFEITKDVPFDPQAIAECLDLVVKIDKAWLTFFKNQCIVYEAISYEVFSENYERTIGDILEKIGVPESEQNIPEPPMKKISNEVNDRLREQFIEFVTGQSGEEDYEMILG